MVFNDFLDHLEVHFGNIYNYFMIFLWFIYDIYGLRMFFVIFAGCPLTSFACLFVCIFYAFFCHPFVVSSYYFCFVSMVQHNIQHANQTAKSATRTTKHSY